MNFCFVVLGPPLLEIAVLVELAALVVEAVREFVADGRAHVAVIRGVIFLVAEEGRLKISGGEVDVVLLRTVVGVDGGRRHVPLALVDGLADLGEVAIEVEHAHALLVAERIAAHDFEL